MKNYVSYPKEMRQRAIDDQKGLYSIDLISPSKRPGKLGCRMTLQGPIDFEEWKKICEFMASLVTSRSKK